MREQAQQFDPRQNMLTHSFEVFHYKDACLDPVAMHHHDFFEVYLFLSGRVEYRVEGRTYCLAPGDLLLISPLELHQPIVEASQKPYERIVLWINRGFLESFATERATLTRCFDSTQPNHTNLLRLTSAQRTAVTAQMGKLVRESYVIEYGSSQYALGIFLQLMVEINRIAERAVETAQNRYNRIKVGEPPSRKFVDNRFILQLEVNKQLLDFRENQKKNWANEESFVRSLYKQIQETDYYKEYMASPESSYAQDRELWRKIYKNIISNNEELDSLLEDMSLYWNDDKFIVDTFVLKTIKRFDEANGADQELLPEFKDEEDREFAHKLFRNTLLNADYYRKLVSDNTKNWEFNRIALMDLVIMQIALAEILTFPNIPLSVTLNEYVDIAKVYSTPKSGAYVNGLLDVIAKKLMADKVLTKTIN